MPSAAHIRERDYLARQRARDARLDASRATAGAKRQADFAAAASWLRDEMAPELTRAGGASAQIVITDNFSDTGSDAYRAPALVIAVSFPSGVRQRYEICTKHGLITVFDISAGRRELAIPDRPGPQLVRGADSHMAREIALLLAAPH